MFDLKVNKKLLPIKGHFFLWSTGTTPLLSFLPIYARQLGFGSFIVGTVFTVLPFWGMLANLLLGAVADKHKCQKLIFLAVQFIQAAASFSIIFLPEMPSKAEIGFACNNSEAVLEACGCNSAGAVQSLQDEVSNNEVLCDLSCFLDLQSRQTVCNYWKSEKLCKSGSENLRFSVYVVNFIEDTGDCIGFKEKDALFKRCLNYSDHPKILTSCDIKCSFHAMDDFLAQPALDDARVVKYHQFWSLLTIYLIWWMCQAVTVSIGDAICFQVLEDEPNKFGNQLMWGSVGWGMFSIIVGVLVDAFSEDETKKNYTPVFLLGFGAVLLSAVVSFTIQFTQQHTSPSILKDIGRLLAKLRIIIFILWCTCVGICTGLTWNFLFWLLEDLAAIHGQEMQSRIKTVEGLVLGMQCFAGDIPFLFLSGWILKRVGHVHSMNLVLLVTGVKFILFSVMTNPWWSLAVELLHGPTFGLFYATMASYASIVAPPGTEATTQGLVCAVFEGVGVSTGSFIGGLLFQSVGGSATFRIVGAFALIACAAHACAQYLIQKGADGSKYM